MEKKEAIREWCIERAMSLCAYRAEVGESYTTKDVIDVAKKIEAYITDNENKNSQ